jgi:hypothetical protein
MRIGWAAAARPASRGGKTFWTGVVNEVLGKPDKLRQLLSALSTRHMVMNQCG